MIFAAPLGQNQKKTERKFFEIEIDKILKIMKGYMLLKNTVNLIYVTADRFFRPLKNGTSSHKCQPGLNFAEKKLANNGRIAQSFRALYLDMFSFTIKRLFLLILLVTTASSSAASGPEILRFRAFAEAEIATKEQSESVLFSAYMMGCAISFEIQNQLPDSMIVGIIIRVSYKDPDSGKQQTLDVYADCQNTLPFSYYQGSVAFFHSTEIGKLNPSLSLKEIRIEKILPFSGK